MRNRPWTWGLAAAGTYVAVAAALAATGRPVLPLFDGQAPPTPYRWVDPPDDFADTNQAPFPGRQEIPLEGEAPALVNAFTDDGQAVLTGPDTTFPPEEGQEAVEVTLTPLDPDEVGPPPDNLAFDGNAYVVQAIYRPSGEPVPVAAPATLVLRYPVHATTVLRWDGSAWRPVPGTNPIPATLQVFVDVRELGTFVAAGPPTETSALPRLLGYAAAALALLAIVLYPTIRSRIERARAQRRKGRPPVRRKRGRK